MSQGFYGFPNVLGVLRATTFKAMGKIGATAGAALAGATTSGAPTSGQFDVGDAVIDQTGVLWICTTAGSPGTFVQAGFANPLTTRGDLLVQGASGTTRLALGSTNYVLTSNGTDVAWAVSPAGAGGALTQIAQTTLSGAAASIDFSGIAASYSHLLLYYTARSAFAGSTQDNLMVRYNNDSTSGHYDDERVMGFGGSSQFTMVGNGAAQANVGPIAAANAAGGLFGTGELRVPNYAQTTAEKDSFSQFTQVLGTGSSDTRAGVMAQHWRSTAAINRITLFATSGNLAIGSSVTLYGVS